MNIMRKQSVMLCLLIVLAFLQSAGAQEKFSMGPRVGVNFASVGGDNVLDAEANTRLVLGLTSTYSINEKAGIGIDLLYSGEGSERGDELENLAMNYLRIPIMFQYFFRDIEDDFRPKIYAGVAPGFLLTAEVGEQDVKDSYNSFDLGGTAGLGFHYRLSPRGVWLNTDLRYMRGLSNLLDNNGATELFNKQWQASVGVAFGL